MTGPAHLYKQYTSRHIYLVYYLSCLNKQNNRRMTFNQIILILPHNSKKIPYKLTNKTASSSCCYHCYSKLYMLFFV